MPEEIIEGADGSYVKKMQASRDAPAVMKVQIANIRASGSIVPIFAFEGDDDKIVYGCWIERIRAGLRYEPFPCKGKKGVLALFDMLARDKGDLIADIYFFVDRDYDDLVGRECNDKIYMTNSYSVENHLVCSEVLDRTLTNEFHCHGRIDIRESIRARFEQDYSQLLAVTKEVNFRLYVAKALGITTPQPAPELNAIVRIQIGEVSGTEAVAADLVQFNEEPTAEDLAENRIAFDAFDPKMRYRGKYAYKFMMKWLRCLEQAYKDRESACFGDIDRTSNVRSNEYGLNAFASRSRFPDCLAEFLRAVVVH